MNDREKVIKGLECCCQLGAGSCDECPYRGDGDKPWRCSELRREALELLKEQEESGWISVKDRLPEPAKTEEDDGSSWTESEPVPVWTGASTQTAKYIVESDRVFWNNDFGDNLTVSHWMPLPPSPEEENDE